MRVHPVFHVSLLEPAAQDPLSGQRSPPPPPVEVNGEFEYEVEQILDSRFQGSSPQRNLRYLVSWKGYPDQTWEPPIALEHAPRLVHQYHRRYPYKPRPDKLPSLNSDSDADWSSDSSPD